MVFSSLAPAAKNKEAMDQAFKPKVTLVTLTPAQTTSLLEALRWR